MAAAYNPYNDAQQIVNKKQLYNKSVAAKTGDQDLYAKSAQVYYQKLRDNGFGDLADELSKADEPTALQILARYGGTTNSNRKVAAASDRPLPESQVSGAGTGTGTGASAGGSASYNDSLQSGLNVLGQYIQPSAAQDVSNSQAQSNLQATYDLFTKNNANTEARGNDLWDQMSKYGADQTKRYEDLYGYIKNTSAVDTPEGKSIMSYYNNLGGQASKDATAQAAGANAGNIDSYSAANANRQQLSYLNSGTQAALNQKNSNAGNMLSTLQSLGVDVGDLQNRQLSMYQGDQKYNTDVLSGYNEGQNNVASQLQNQKNAGNDLISNYMTNLLGVNTNETALKQTQNTNETALKQTEATNKSNEIMKELDVVIKKYEADSTAANALAVQDSINATTIKVQELVNEGTITQAEGDALVAKINAAADVTVSENNAGATVGAASINAQGGMTEAQIKADSDADIAYYQSLAKQNTGKADASNPTYLELLKQVKAISQGKSSLTGNKTVAPATAAQILLKDVRYKDYSGLLSAAAKEVETMGTSVTAGGYEQIAKDRLN